ncbi:hypothetical protein [Streptomyces sp. TS71-3]|uniref:hypothetical protein n=1 Tax=Streptomyces sp. TS71-3 TaxID=2733862 RepID=UPI001B1D752F|nr:hypothetical protein [Streptomyces sp. TS71-3]GHJ37862.1 hypothetical protein Sm713_34710 [Streptomyces sp. TS71-3]
MMNNTKIGAALVGGYLLGRTKKAKMAIGLGMFLAGKKLDLDPRRLASKLSDSPLLAGLNDQVRRDVLDTTKSAAASALTHRIGGLADSLQRRALALDDKAEEPAERGPEDDADPEDPDGDLVEGGVEREEPDGGGQRSARTATRARAQEPSGGRAASASRAGTSGGARRTASGARRAASAAPKETPSARGAASGARKTASGAPKTTSGARKTASGTARKASNRGGSNV